MKNRVGWGEKRGEKRGGGGGGREWGNINRSTDTLCTLCTYLNR